MDMDMDTDMDKDIDMDTDARHGRKFWTLSEFLSTLTHDTHKKTTLIHSML